MGNKKLRILRSFLLHGNLNPAFATFVVDFDKRKGIAVALNNKFVIELTSQQFKDFDGGRVVDILISKEAGVCEGGTIVWEFEGKKGVAQVTASGGVFSNLRKFFIKKVPEKTSG